MIISIIVATSKNNVIGYKNKIPWHLPEDMYWFKIITLNKSIIMGRLTWESMNCQPLKNRKNIIVSKKYFEKKNDKVIYVQSIEAAVQAADQQKEIMVIGGSNIYKQFLKFSKRIYLTKINKIFKGDTYFPKYNRLEWKILFKKYFINSKEKYSYYFSVLENLNVKKFF